MITRNSPLRHGFIWLIACLIFAPAFASAVDLSGSMTPEQFEKAGLRKQSPEELAYLNSWLTGFVQGQAESTRKQRQAAAKSIKKREKEKRFGARQVRAHEYMVEPQGTASTKEKTTVDADKFGKREVLDRVEQESRRRVLRLSSKEQKKERKEEKKATKEEKKVSREEFPGKEKFESRLAEEFRGWSGATIFYLANGQVWKQRLEGYYRHKGEIGPRVEIVKLRFGYWLWLPDFRVGVGVRRVE